jgi:hypothetical protein
MELTGARRPKEQRIVIDPIEVEQMVREFNRLLRRHAEKLNDVIDSLKRQNETQG